MSKARVIRKRLAPGYLVIFSRMRRPPAILVEEIKPGTWKVIGLTSKNCLRMISGMNPERTEINLHEAGNFRVKQ